MTTVVVLLLSNSIFGILTVNIFFLNLYFIMTLVTRMGKTSRNPLET